MSPQTALTDLSCAPLIKLKEAPDGVPGLCLLHDHTHTPRYIGKTGNLHHRIHRRTPWKPRLFRAGRKWGQNFLNSGNGQYWVHDDDQGL